MPDGCMLPDDGEDFSDIVDGSGQPSHHTMMEALRYGWGNGERKLMVVVGVTMVVMSSVAAWGLWNFITGTESVSAHPFEVHIPVQVEDRIDGVDGPATDDGDVTFAIEGCNTTRRALLLGFTGQWVKYDGQDSTSAPSYLVPADPIYGVAVPPGDGSCLSSPQDPARTTIALPEAVAEDPGVWQLSVQVEVNACHEYTSSPGLGMESVQCTTPGEPLDQAGWYTERFQVFLEEG